MKALLKWTHANTKYRIIPHEEGSVRAAYELCEADLWFVVQRRRTSLMEILRNFSVWETLFDEKVPDLYYREAMAEYLQSKSQILGRCRLELNLPAGLVAA